MPKGHFVRTEEHKRHIAEAKRGVKRPKEVGDKISASKVAAQRKWSPEEREAHRVYAELNGNPFKGAKHTEDTREKMRAAKVGKVPSALIKYGITNEEYAKQCAAGNRWCFVKKHFTNTQFLSGAKCCIDCRSQYHRYVLLRGKYGIDQEWYEHRLASQGGGCAICGSTEVQAGRNHMHIDHCHQTDQLRGILCTKCNWAVERLDSVPDWAVKAAVYHMKYRQLLGSGTAEIRKGDCRKYKRNPSSPLEP